MNRRLQNMRKNKAKKRLNKRRNPSVAPFYPMDSDFHQAMGDFLLQAVALCGPAFSLKNPPSSHKQLPGPKQNEVQLESGVYLSGKGIK